MVLMLFKSERFSSGLSFMQCCHFFHAKLSQVFDVDLLALEVEFL